MTELIGHFSFVKKSILSFCWTYQPESHDIAPCLIFLSLCIFSHVPPAQKIFTAFIQTASTNWQRWSLEVTCIPTVLISKVASSSPEASTSCRSQLMMFYRVSYWKSLIFMSTQMDCFIIFETEIYLSSSYQLFQICQSERIRFKDARGPNLDGDGK